MVVITFPDIKLPSVSKDVWNIWKDTWIYRDSIISTRDQCWVKKYAWKMCLCSNEKSAYLWQWPK